METSPLSDIEVQLQDHTQATNAQLNKLGNTHGEIVNLKKKIVDLGILISDLKQQLEESKNIPMTNKNKT